MGIQGLLPFLQKSTRKVNMTEFSGCTVAVDAYCWLHKGAFSCAEKLARGEQTDQYVTYCMKFVSMLLSHNIKPILVFDGSHLPAKANTEKARRERREANRRKAGELLRQDRGEEARSLLRRCVDVTHEMAHSLIKECRSRNVDCIVAPFEADAQLAYLNISGLAHFVITEDSDLILFGCTKVVFKMDVQGQGLLVEQEKLPLSLKMRPEVFTFDKFVYMCILSGCDYLSSLPGIGLVKALKFVRQTAEEDISKVLPKLGSYLNMAGLDVPIEYIEKFKHSVLMFRHQTVYDPRSRQLIPLTPLPPATPNPIILAHPSDMYTQIAFGNIDPVSLKVVDNWNPDNSPGSLSVNSKGWNVKAKHVSIWSKEYKLPGTLPPQPDPRQVSRPSTFSKKTLHTPVIDRLSPAKLSEEKELEMMRKQYNVTPKKQTFQELLEKDDELVSVDDLLNEETKQSKVFTSRNQSSPSRQKTSGLAKLSRLSRSQLGSPGKVVQSKYFASEDGPAPPSSSEPHKEQEPLDVFNIIERVIQADTVHKSPPKTPKETPKKRKIFVVPNSREKRQRATEEPSPATAERKGVLSQLQDNDGGGCSTSRLSLFKWSRPLDSAHCPLRRPRDDPLDMAAPLLSHTPPNSQDSPAQSSGRLAPVVSCDQTASRSQTSSAETPLRLPALHPLLQPSARVGLSRKKRPTTTPNKSSSTLKKLTSSTPPTKQMSLLTMYGFKPREKLKTT